MNLKNISNHELISRMQKLVSSERKITHLVLLHILEIENRRLYAELGYESLFTYLTKHLGYCEASAYRRMQSARLLKQVPGISQKLESGSLNLSQLTQVQKCIKEENGNGGFVSNSKAQNILAKIVGKNSFETKSILAKEFSQPIKTQCVIKPQQDESIRSEVTFTKEEYKGLKTAKDLLSHVCPDNSWSEVISTLAIKFNQSKLGKPILKKPISSKPSSSKTKSQSSMKATNQSTTKASPAKMFSGQEGQKTAFQDGCTNAAAITAVITPGSQNDSPSNTTPATQRFYAKQTRAYIAVKTKRQLFLNANHQRQYTDKKSRTRCQSTYQLQIDHIQPIAMNGSNMVSNLRVLCRTHNLLMSQKANLQRPL